MTWAARYSRTEQPELTIWRDGEEQERLNTEAAVIALGLPWLVTDGHPLRDDPDLRADIAARVPVRECEETQACTNWAMPDGRCHHVHGGSDEL